MKGQNFFFASNTDNERLGLRSTLAKRYSPDDITNLTTSYGLDFTENRFYRPQVDPERGGAIVGFVTPETTLETTAISGQLELRVGRFNLSGGVRHEWYAGKIGDDGFHRRLLGRLLAPHRPQGPRIHLQMKAKGQDLALFHLANDSNRAVVILVRLKVGDVAHGCII